MKFFMVRCAPRAFAAFAIIALCGASSDANMRARAEESAPVTASINAPAPAISSPIPSSPIARTAISLSEALQLARAHSRTLQGASARIDAAGARLKAAGALPNPVLALAQPYALDKGTTGGFDEGVLLTQTVELGGKRSSRVAAAKSEKNAALFLKTATATDLDFAVQSAYFQALRADAEYSLASDQLKTAQSFLNAAHEQEAAGDAPRRDIVRSAVEADRAGSTLAQTDADRANRYATLRSLLGFPEGAPLELSDKLTFVPQVFPIEDLQNLALKNRADLEAARLQREAREADVKGARSQYFPDLFLEGRRAELDPKTPGTSVRVGLTVPLFDFGRTKSGVREAQANVREQQANIDEATRVALLEVSTARQTLEAATKVVQSFQNGRLQRATELLDMAQTGYAEGASPYLEVLDARSIYRSEQTDYTRALSDWNIARADLARAVGGSLPSTNLPPAKPLTK